MYNSIYMYMGSGKIPSHLSFSRLSIRKSVHRFGTEASKITMNCVISGYFNHRCSMAWHMDSKNSKGTTKQKVVLKISKQTKSLKIIFTFGGGKKKSGVFFLTLWKSYHPPPNASPASTRTATQMLKGRPPSSASFTLNRHRSVGNGWKFRAKVVAVVEAFFWGTSRKTQNTILCFFVGLLRMVGTLMMLGATDSLRDLMFQCIMT